MSNENQEGGFVSHLTELRKRLINSFIFLFIFFVICYLFAEHIYGFLVDPFARAVKEINPKVLIAENVRGLISHEKGKTLTTISNVIDELGYELVEPKVLKTYRGARELSQLLPTVAKGFMPGSGGVKKQAEIQDKKNRERYKNPKGVERVMTGFADKLTKDKYDFDKRGPSKTKKEHYDWRSTLDEKCWAGYEKKGMKTMFGKRYPNCVKKSKKKK